MKEKILYLVFGFFTTIIYLGTYKALLDFNITYLLSANISFIFAIIFAFTTNKYIVFKKESSLLKESIMFFVARILTQLINNFGLVIFIEFFKIDEFVSQVILSIIVVILNYILSKYAIFK